MIVERQVQIADRLYPVVIADEQQALQAAKAAGKAIVGYLHAGGEQDLSPAIYLVECLDTLAESLAAAQGSAASQSYLARVICRQFGLPWKIGETERLCIREFTLADVNHMHQEPQDREGDRIFYTPEKLDAYIQNQYGFYEYGIWAIVRKADGVLLGKAGVDFFDPGTILDGQISGDKSFQLELGYHIFQPYRRQGYAGEACQAIAKYVKETWNCPVYAVVEGDNFPSTRLLKKMKFHFMGQGYSPKGQPQSLFAWNC